MSWAESSPGMMAGQTPVNGHHPEEDGEQYPLPQSKRKNVVFVGLGMVGIAFMFAFRGRCCEGELLTRLYPERSSRSWMPSDVNTIS